MVYLPTFGWFLCYVGKYTIHGCYGKWSCLSFLISLAEEQRRLNKKNTNHHPNQQSPSGGLDVPYSPRQETSIVEVWDHRFVVFLRTFESSIFGVFLWIFQAITTKKSWRRIRIFQYFSRYSNIWFPGWMSSKKLDHEGKWILWGHQ